MYSPDLNPFFDLRLGYKSPLLSRRKYPPHKKVKMAQRMQQDGPGAYYKKQIGTLSRYKGGKTNPNTLRRQLAAAKRVHSFTRTYAYGIETTDGINPLLSAWALDLNDVPGYTELTALYDFYTIKRIKLTFLPYQTQSVSTSSVNNAQNVPIFYAVDLNDQSAPGSVNEVLEYQNCKTSATYKGFSCYWAPKFIDATSAERKGWISTASPSTKWYGVKVAIPPTGSAVKFYVTAKMYMQFKMPK